MLTPRPPETLLRPEWMAWCELWKQNYADWLLRMGLLGPRTDLLQHNFCEDRGAADDVTSDSTGVGQLHEQTDRHGLSERCSSMETPHLTPSACPTCVPGMPPCPACSDLPIRPTCAVCSLPIKGLSSACALCQHRTHTRCLQLYHSSRGKAPATCPACSCNCFVNGGLTASNVTLSASHEVPPIVTRNIVSPTWTPTSNISNPQPPSATRLTYASLARTFEAIRHPTSAIEARQDSTFPFVWPRARPPDTVSRHMSMSHATPPPPEEGGVPMGRTDTQGAMARLRHLTGEWRQ